MVGMKNWRGSMALERKIHWTRGGKQLKKGWVRYRHAGVKGLDMNFNRSNKKAVSNAKKHVSNHPEETNYNINYRNYSNHSDAMKHFA